MLGIRRMRVLGAFPALAVLNDLKISNFPGGACPQTPLQCRSQTKRPTEAGRSC